MLKDKTTQLLISHQQQQIVDTITSYYKEPIGATSVTPITPVSDEHPMDISREFSTGYQSVSVTSWGKEEAIMVASLPKESQDPHTFGMHNILVAVEVTSCQS